MSYVVFRKQARKSAKGAIFAPGRNTETGKYLIFKLCENYDRRVRGGIRKTWRYVAKDLSLEEAKTLFAKRLGQKGGA